MTQSQFIEEIRANLTENILPYWMNKMVDPVGGFYARRDGYDQLDTSTSKGAILNARILWAFSAAYRILGNQEYLEMATRAKREIIDRFYDSVYGGVFWSLNDDKKQFYAIGFAIYGLSEYTRTTGDAEALDYAVRLFHDIENHSRDCKNGGYIEALKRDWTAIADMRLSEKDANAQKTMNTHLHIIEPYTNLLRVWHDAELQKAAVELVRIFLDKILQKDNHLGLFFDNEWQRQDAEISYGHGIEASWLLLEAAQVIGDDKLLKETLSATSKIAKASLEGRCPDGSMIYERHADGTYDDEKHWWVQAENVVGQLYLYLYHNNDNMLVNAMQSWQYIKDNLVDNLNGEWLWSIKDGSPNKADDKAGFWKCPYHNSRMCLEIIERLNN